MSDDQIDRTLRAAFWVGRIGFYVFWGAVIVLVLAVLS